VDPPNPRRALLRRGCVIRGCGSHEPLRCESSGICGDSECAILRLFLGVKGQNGRWSTIRQFAGARATEAYPATKAAASDA